MPILTRSQRTEDVSSGSSFQFAAVVKPAATTTASSTNRRASTAHSLKDANVLVDLAAPLPLSSSSPFKSSKSNNTMFGASSSSSSSAASSLALATRSLRRNALSNLVNKVNKLAATVDLNVHQQLTRGTSTDANKENEPAVAMVEEVLDARDQEWAELNKPDAPHAIETAAAPIETATPGRRSTRARASLAPTVNLTFEVTDGAVVDSHFQEISNNNHSATPAAKNARLSMMGGSASASKLNSRSRRSSTRGGSAMKAPAIDLVSSNSSVSSSEDQQQHDDFAGSIANEFEDEDAVPMQGSLTPSSYARRKSTSKPIVRKADRRSLHHTQLQLLKQLVDEEEEEEKKFAAEEETQQIEEEVVVAEEPKEEVVVVAPQPSPMKAKTPSKKAEQTPAASPISSRKMRQSAPIASPLPPSAPASSPIHPSASPSMKSARKSAAPTPSRKSMFESTPAAALFGGGFMFHGATPTVNKSRKSTPAPSPIAPEDEIEEGEIVDDVPSIPAKQERQITPRSGSRRRSYEHRQDDDEEEQPVEVVMQDIDAEEQVEDEEIVESEENEAEEHAASQEEEAEAEPVAVAPVLATPQCSPVFTRSRTSTPLPVELSLGPSHATPARSARKAKSLATPTPMPTPARNATEAAVPEVVEVEAAVVPTSTRKTRRSIASSPVAEPTPVSKAMLEPFIAEAKLDLSQIPSIHEEIALVEAQVDEEEDVDFSESVQEEAAEEPIRVTRSTPRSTPRKTPSKSVKSSPVKIATPAQEQSRKNTPAKSVTPVASPAKNQTPVASPAKRQTPIASPAKELIKEATPVKAQTPSKVATPVTSSKKQSKQATPVAEPVDTASPAVAKPRSKRSLVNVVAKDFTKGASSAIPDDILKQLFTRSKPMAGGATVEESEVEDAQQESEEEDSFEMVEAEQEEDEEEVDEDDEEAEEEDLAVPAIMDEPELLSAIVEEEPKVETEDVASVEEAPVASPSPVASRRRSTRSSSRTPARDSAQEAIAAEEKPMPSTPAPSRNMVEPVTPFTPAAVSSTRMRTEVVSWGAFVGRLKNAYSTNPKEFVLYIFAFVAVLLALGFVF